MKTTDSICEDRQSTFNYLMGKYKMVLVEARALKDEIRRVMDQETRMAFNGYITESREFQAPLKLLAEEQMLLNDKIKALRNTLQLLHSDFEELTTLELIETNPLITKVDFLPNWCPTPLGRG